MDHRNSSGKTVQVSTVRTIRANDGTWPVRLLLLALFAATLMVLTSPAEAGHRHWNDYYRHQDRWDDHWDGGHYWGNRWDYHPQQHHGYYYNDGWGRHHYDRRHRQNRNKEGLYLLGGVLVGALVTHAIHENRPEPRISRQPVYRERVYDSGPVVRSSRIVRGAEGHRLFRDRNGDCFERTISSRGEEVLVEVDHRECAW
ncbi:MAG: hypothetical protein FJ194_17985 [Gammaproteobacteria bacterium]|nr:hypothetical protein [Gammaproteobacteria bacterium]